LKHFLSCFYIDKKIVKILFFIDLKNETLYNINVNFNHKNVKKEQER